MSSDSLNAIEKRAALSLSLVFAMRMLGLFMIMPVFAIYGQHLTGYSPLWVGLAIGAYGLTQALLQIPAGWLSDKIGRRPVIYAGLLIFALGSLIAAFSDSIYTVILGRALQGAGAIASAILALAADVTREQQRPKAMGMIGISIGLAFTVAMVLGPILAPQIGLSGLFYITALGALSGIFIVHQYVPKQSIKAPRGETIAIPRLLVALLKKPELLRLNLGIFILHLSLTAVFVTLPLQLVEMGLAAPEHWFIYLPALLLSFLLIIPMLVVAAKKRKNKHFYLANILLMAFSLLAILFNNNSLLLMFLLLILFFTAFNFLEASLPAFISMLAPAGSKGSAMGIYSSCQFFGAFCGGVLGGLSYELLGSNGIFLSLTGLMLIWFAFSYKMSNPSKIRTFTFQVTEAQHKDSVIQQLKALPGAMEVVPVFNEQTLYLKANTQLFQLNAAQTILNKS